MDKKTIDTYNKLAKEYDEETVDFWERFPRTIIEKFVKLIEPEGKILDVGSGPGRDGLILKNEGFNVICLDASESMVEIAKGKGLEAINGDFINLPFEDGSFDGVWAYTSLLHVPKSEFGKAIAEIHRVLKPGGVFGLGLIEGDRELYRESSGVDRPRWFSFYKKDEVERILDNNGFELNHFEEFKPSAKNYLNFISKKSQ